MKRKRGPSSLEPMSQILGGGSNAARTLGDEEDGQEERGDRGRSREGRTPS